jgi:hypothetical protein
MRHRLLAIVATTALAVTTLVAHPGASIAVHPDGRVYFVDTGAGIFSIETDGRVVRRDGPAYHWFALDVTGRFAATPWPALSGAELRGAGTRPGVILSSDYPVAIGRDALYYPQSLGGGRMQIVGIAPSGARSVRANLPALRSGGAVATWLNGLAAGPDGSLYYTEDRAVRRIDPQGRVSTVVEGLALRDCTAIPGIEAGIRPYLRGLAVAA